MAQEESFDSFYRATRRQVLLQAFALTGDLPAAQAAVRDAYVGSWQHWRKVSRFEDPLDWARPRAWQLAQRRHSARIWHRNKGLSEDHAAVLDALAGLPMAQRRLLLLVELGGLDLGPAGRELGVTQETAALNLSRAISALADRLDVDPATLPGRLAGLDTLVADATLPRAPIVRRAGRKRRHLNALVGATTAVALALASGAFAYQPSTSSAEDLRLVTPPPSTSHAELAAPTGRNLLDQDQIARLGPGQRWRVAATSDNTSGDGINTVCQQTRFADPRGYAAMVRTFSALGGPTRSAVQTVEVSRSQMQAERGFTATVDWYAGCRVGRLQVLHAYKVDNIGDDADVLMLRIWKKPVTTLSVAVARTGKVTTSTVGTTVGGSPPPARQITQSLADAVAMLCARSGSQNCAKQPAYRVVPPPPSGEERGILAVADLPPVGRIAEPWVGTTPASARVNPSATTCDRADFAKAGATSTRTRTYLIPQASLPARFGLSETYGVFRTPSAAARFLSAIRSTVGRCEHRDLATKVSAEHRERRSTPQLDLSSWDLHTEITAHQKVRFRLGFVRVGRTVAQLTFAPSPRDDITTTGFHALLVRAGDRLRELG